LPPVTPDPVDSQKNAIATWGGWALVFIVFGFLILASLQGPTEKEVKSKKPPKFSRADLVQVRFLLSTEAITGKTESSTWKPIEEEFLKNQPPSTDRDVVVAFARYRQGLELTQALQNSLQRAKSPLAKDALMVFQKQKLDEAESKALVQRQKMDQVGRLVLVAAAEQRGESRAAERIIGTGLASGMMALLGLVLPLLALSVMAYFAVFRNRIWEKMPPIPIPAPLTGDGAMLGLYGVLILVGFQIFNLIAAYGGAEFGGIGGAITGMLFVVVLLITLDRIPWYGQTLLSQMHESRFTMPQLIGIGALAYGFLIPIMLLLMAIMMPLITQYSKGHPAQELTQNGLTPMGFVALAISAAFVAPIWEEISFRGLLWAGLQRLVRSPALSLILVSFLFAAIHAQGPALWVILGSISVVAGLAYRFTGSIVPAIVLHAVHNFLIVLAGHVATL